MVAQQWRRLRRKWPVGTIVHVKLDFVNGKLTVDDRTIDVPTHEELHPVFMLYKKQQMYTAAYKMNKQIRTMN